MLKWVHLKYTSHMKLKTNITNPTVTVIWSNHITSFTTAKESTPQECPVVQPSRAALISVAPSQSWFPTTRSSILLRAAMGAMTFPPRKQVVQPPTSNLASFMLNNKHMKPSNSCVMHTCVSLTIASSISNSHGSLQKTASETKYLNL